MGSKSSSAATTTNKDGRVAVDNNSIGVSSEGPVTVHVVPDEAFELGREAIYEVADIAQGSMKIGADQSKIVADTLGEALVKTQEAQRTEATQLSETIIKMAIPAAAIAYIAGRVLD